jgi:hypothetical protein
MASEPRLGVSCAWWGMAGVKRSQERSQERSHWRLAGRFWTAMDMATVAQPYWTGDALRQQLGRLCVVRYARAGWSSARRCRTRETVGWLHGM